MPVFEIFLKDHFAAPRLAENILVFHICPQKNRIVTKLCSHAGNDIFELHAKFKQNIGASFLRYFLKVIFPLRDWQKISLCFISPLRKIGSLPNFAVMLVMIYLNYLQNLNKILGPVFEIRDIS